MEKKIYKEPEKEEMETTINDLYSENILSIYTNNVSLQRQLNNLKNFLKIIVKIFNIWYYKHILKICERKNKIARTLNSLNKFIAIYFDFNSKCNFVIKY